MRLLTFDKYSFSYLFYFTGLYYDLTNISWVNKIKSHGKCVVLNKNAELEPVRCDSMHSTICSVNKSLLVKTENGGISEEKEHTDEPASKGA